MSVRRLERRVQIRRASFAQINASWAIEGQIMDATDLARQDLVARAQLSHEEAIAQVCRTYGLGRQWSRARRA